MKSLITIVGLLLLIGGILTVAYQGFTYTNQEKIAQIGDLKITANTQKTVNIPPVLGGISIVAGLILVIASRKF